MILGSAYRYLLLVISCYTYSDSRNTMTIVFIPIPTCCSYESVCGAKHCGECSFHPFNDGVQKRLAGGSSWFNIVCEDEERAEAAMTDEQRAQRQALEAARRVHADKQRAVQAAAHEAQLLAAREQKAVGDAAELSRALAKKRVDLTKTLCIWVRLQEEALTLQRSGCTPSTLLTQKTPGRETITVKDALGGCFAHAKFISGKSKCDCPFPHSTEPVVLKKW